MGEKVNKNYMLQEEAKLGERQNNINQYQSDTVWQMMSTVRLYRIQKKI